MLNPQMTSQPNPPGPIESILETVVYCSTETEEATRSFYAEVLGLRRVSQWAFRVDAGHLLLLFNADESSVREKPPRHGARGSVHVGFTVEAGAYDAWKTYLQACGVEVTAEITWEGSVRSFYFDDPAGNLLEIASGDMWPQ